MYFTLVVDVLWSLSLLLKTSVRLNCQRWMDRVHSRAILAFIEHSSTSVGEEEKYVIWKPLDVTLFQNVLRSIIKSFSSLFQVRRLLTFKLSRVFRRILRRPDAMVFTKGSFVILHTKFQPQLPIDLVCNTFLCAFTILYSSGNHVFPPYTHGGK